MTKSNNPKATINTIIAPNELAGIYLEEEFESRLKTALIALHNNKLFEFVVIGVIILSSLLIGVKTYDIDPNYLSVLQVVGIVPLLTPVFALLLGSTLNHEHITLTQFFGIALVLSGLLVYEYGPKKIPKSISAL